jgi:hypothetical protein
MDSPDSAPAASPDTPALAPVQASHAKVSWLRNKVAAARHLSRSLTKNFPSWFASVTCVIIMPCLPVIIEWMRSGYDKSDTMTLTAAVLSIGFCVTTESIMLFFVYFLLFLTNILVNTVVGPNSPVILTGWEGYLLLGVIGLHAIERGRWHVVLDRPFPDTQWMRRISGQER